MAKCILLTGATGFLGSHLLAALLRQGFKVAILKRSTSDFWRITPLLEQINSYNIDQEPIEKAFDEQGIDAVIHTACCYGRNGEPLSQVVETNLMFGLRLLDTAITYNTETFFNTDTLLHKQLNAYTHSKKQFVEWLEQQSAKIRVINLKLEHMYGPKDDRKKFIPWLVDRLLTQASEIKLTKGEQKRDFVYIDDVVSAYLHLLQSGHSLDTFSEFEVGAGETLAVRDFVQQLVSALEVKTGLEFRDRLVFGALPYREGEPMKISADIASLVQLGWSPCTSLTVGISKTIEDIG